MTRHTFVVVGGGLASVAAAIAAARLGVRTVIVSECEWIGGQVSAQAIPPDEHPWIETVGCTHSYRTFRDGVRSFYRSHYPLTHEARDSRYLNPGDGNIGPLSHEPFVAELVLEQMIAPWRSRGLIDVLRGWTVTQAEVDADRISAITVVSADGEEKCLVGDYFLDGTDLGDLIAASGTEHVIGAESQSQTGEPHALDGTPDPTDQQAITWALALTWSPGTDNIVDKPASYDAWRTYQPEFWPGPMLGWTVSDHVTHQPRQRPLFVDNSAGSGIRYDLWHARRVLSAGNMSGVWESDNTIAAWPMMDYWQTPLVGGTAEDTSRALEESKEFSTSFLHWMQTEAPRHDGGTGYPELRTHPGVTGTGDGFAMMPYVREGRRIVAEFTVCEQHIGVTARPGAEGAESFFDSVGVGAYRIDLHPSSSGRNALDLDTWPFQIPLGALIPARIGNLLAAGKTMGTTHLTNGAFRVHPSEWASGEAAGALAAFCLLRQYVPTQVRNDSRRLTEFQSTLTDVLGCETAWPTYDALTPIRRFGYVPSSGGSA